MSRITIDGKEYEANPSWATEDTLRAVRDILRGLPSSTRESASQVVNGIKASSDANAKLISDELKNINDGFSRDFMGNSLDVLNDYSRQSMTATVEQRGFTSKLLEKMFMSASESTRRLGREFDITALKSANLGTAFLGLTIGMATYLGKELVNQAVMYRDLYRQGLLYSRAGDSTTASMGRLGNAAIAAGITLKDMQGLLQKYSRVLTRDGIENFSRMSNVVSEFGSQYALTHAESAEYLAEYMEMQRASGVLYTMNNDQIINGAKEQMKHGMEFARQLGISTEELRKQQSEISKTPDMMTAMANIPDHLKATMGPKFQQLIAGMQAGGAKDFSEVLLKLTQSGNLALNDQKLLALRSTGVVGNNIANMMMEISEAFKSGNIGDVADVQRRLAEQFTQLSGSVDPQLIMTLESLRPGVQGFINESNLMKEQMARSSKTDAETRDEAAKKITDTASTFNFLKGAMDSAISKLWQSEGFVTSLQNAMGKLSKYMESGEFQETINKVGDMLITLADNLPTLIRGIGIAADYISEIVGWFNPSNVIPEVEIDSQNIIEKMLGWTAVLFTLPSMIIPLVKNTLVGVFDDVVGLFKTAGMGAVNNLIKVIVGGFSSFDFIKDVVTSITKTAGSLASRFVVFEVLWDTILGVFKGISEFQFDWGFIPNLIFRMAEGFLTGVFGIMRPFYKALAYAAHYIETLFSSEKTMSYDEFSQDFDKQNLLDAKEQELHKLGNIVHDYYLNDERETPAVEQQTYEQTKNQEVTQKSEVEKEQVKRQTQEKEKEEKRKEEEKVYKNKQVSEENVLLNRKIAKNSEDLVSIMDELRGLMERMNDTLITIRNNTKMVPPPQ